MAIPTNVSVGQRITAAFINSILSWINGTSTSYSPALTATTTNPTLGNSTLAGQYVRIGDLVYFRIQLTIGSTFTAGTGVYLLSLPVASAVGANFAIGSGFILNSALRKPVVPSSESTTTVRMIRCSNETAVDNTGPGAAWATGNVATISGVYLAA